MFVRELSAALALLFAMEAPLARAAGAQVTNDGSYTQAQADRGRRIFGAFCASCHGVDLEGAVGPALTGASFSMRWALPDRSAKDLYDLIRTTMPKPAAGSLAESSYLQVLAYLLSTNGLPAGERDLAADAGLTRVHLPAIVVTATARPSAPEFIPGDSGIAPTGAGPSQAELSGAATSSDWLYHTHDYTGTRYSPLRQVTPANAGRLQVVCAYQVGSVESFVTGPLVWRGTMYVTTGRLTIALDAATCRERWRYSWEPREESRWTNNRGAAIKDGYVVRGTPDGYLLALDAATGRLLWARQVAKPSRGETFSMPPLVYQDLVIIGPAGSENNIKGWVGAFRLADGMPVWRFNTVPAPGEPGSETWPDAPGVPVGGGGVWTPVSFDETRGELFVAVTNPAPDFPAAVRAGANLYTNSVVVLDVRTGLLHRYTQSVPNDSHDWDLTQASPLLRLGGRDVVMTAGKEGVLRAHDRTTLEPLYATPVTTMLHTDQVPTRAGTHVCPGVLGGVQWNGPAWYPGTGVLVTPAVDWCTTFSVADTVRLLPGQNYLGGTVKFDSTSQGWLTATDAATGRVRWRYRSERPMVAGVATTAGGVVATGENTGDFLVLDVATGRELYRFNTGGGIGGGVISYAVQGRQYFAAASGRSGRWFGQTGAPTVFVFALPAGSR